MDKIVEVKIDEIKVPKGRYRQEFGDIDELAESLTRFGQLVPIVITEDNVLIAGERRLQAARKCGMQTLKAIVKTHDELMNKVYEIIENLHRKDFSWKEKVKATRDLHNMISAEKESKGEEWSIRKTAEEYKLALGKVSTDLNLADALEKMPDIFDDCKTKREALKRLKEVKIKETLDEIRKRAEKKKQLKQVDVSDFMFLGDCRDLVKSLPDASIDVVLCDPAYGINLDDLKKVSTKSDIYQDDPNIILDAIFKVIEESTRFMKKDSWFIMFCATQYFEVIRNKMEECGYKCDWMPGIWYAPGGAQTNQPNFYLARSYEFFIYGRRGNPTIIKQGRSNVFTFERVKYEQGKQHVVQKPLDLMLELLDTFCLPGHKVLDFMMGSGTTLVACIKKGCLPIGFELDESTYNIAVNRVRKAIELKNAGKGDLIK